MPSFVFRHAEDGAAELLFFDGLHLRPLRALACAADEVRLPLAWGRHNRAAANVAIALCEHCGVPADLLGDVAHLLLVEWVSRMPKGAQNVPEWIVQQEVIRLTMRVMSDLSCLERKDS